MTFDVSAFLMSIENVDKKIPLPEFRQKLTELGLPVSNSWGKTLGTLQDIANSSRIDPELVISLEKLKVWLAYYLLSYSKAVVVFPLASIPSTSVSDLAIRFEAGLPMIHIKSDHPSKFPGLLSKTDIGTFSNRIVLRGTIKDATYISFVFTAVRSYAVRDVIPITAGDMVALTKLSGYTKVIAIKTVSHEHIDIVRFRFDNHPISAAGSIDLMIDVTKPGSTPLNSDEISARATQYIAAVKGAINSVTSGFEMPAHLNFFPAMKKIYESKSGNVCELSFTTTIGGSVKREKMKKNTADLRSETWHAGGRRAISSAAVPDTIDIYRLGVSWKIAASRDEPILTIPGRYRSLSTAEIDHAVVLGCTEQASFDFAFTQLMTFC
jgi:hypothetical protein